MQYLIPSLCLSVADYLSLSVCHCLSVAACRCLSISLSLCLVFSWSLSLYKHIFTNLFVISSSYWHRKVINLRGIERILKLSPFSLPFAPPAIFAQRRHSVPPLFRLVIVSLSLITGLQQALYCVLLGSIWRKIGQSSVKCEQLSNCHTVMYIFILLLFSRSDFSFLVGGSYLQLTLLFYRCTQNHWFMIKNKMKSLN